MRLCSMRLKKYTAAAYVFPFFAGTACVFRKRQNAKKQVKKSKETEVQVEIEV